MGIISGMFSYDTATNDMNTSINVDAGISGNVATEAIQKVTNEISNGAIALKNLIPDDSKVASAITGPTTRFDRLCIDALSGAESIVGFVPVTDHVGKTPATDMATGLSRAYAQLALRVKYDEQ